MWNHTILNLWGQWEIKNILIFHGSLKIQRSYAEKPTYTKLIKIYLIQKKAEKGGERSKTTTTSKRGDKK